MYALSILFGDCTHVKLIESVLDNWEYEFSRADIARMSDLPKSTVNRHFPRFVQEGIVKKTGKKEGKALLYKLNFDSEKTQLLLQLNMQITSERLRENIIKSGRIPLYEFLSQRGSEYMNQAENDPYPGIKRPDTSDGDLISPISFPQSPHFPHRNDLPNDCGITLPRGGLQ